jgi:hypothetical protein
LIQSSLTGFDSVIVNPSACAVGNATVIAKASIPRFMCAAFIDRRA